jgi:PAS domain S-box-containing protein
MCIIGKDDVMIYINDQFTQIFGYTLKDVPNLSTWNQLAFPDERYRQQVSEQIKSKIRQASFEEKMDAQPVEIKVSCQSRAALDILVTGSINDENTVLIFTDITEKKRSDRLLQVAYDRRRRNNLLNELICSVHPSEQILFNVSMMIGRNTGESFTCFLISIDEQADELISHEHERLRTYHLRVDSIIDALENIDQIAWESPEGIGVMCFGHNLSNNIIDEQKEAAIQLRQAISRQVPNVTVSIGIAENSSCITELGVRFQQAAMAVKTGAKIWPHNKTYHYLELGIFQVLSCFTNESHIAEFIDRSLGRLLNYEKKKKDEYLATLEVILESDNLKESASKLAIHYHSLLFRKQRLEKILGVSLDAISSRMTILTALQLLKMRK